MSSIKIINDDHWHALRTKYVGASESAALFGLLPWKSHWQLHMEKAGKLPPPDLDDVKHIKQGKFFEAPIAAWAEQKFGITLNKVRRYMVADDCPGMGASLDYQQVGTGEYIDSEVKWVVRKGDHWAYDGDLITEAPDYYAIQCQHQMGCSGSAKAQLIAFIDGDVRRVVYDRRPKMIDLIKQKIGEFWADVRTGKEPPIDFKADAEAVMQYAMLSPMRKIDWNPKLAALASAAYDAAKLSGEMEEAAKGAKAELAHMMGEAARKLGANDEGGKVVTEGDGFRITYSHVAAYEGKEVTKEMLGTRIGARAGFPKVTVSKPKQKGEKAAQ